MTCFQKLKASIIWYAIQQNTGKLIINTLYISLWRGWLQHSTTTSGDRYLKNSTLFQHTHKQNTPSPPLLTQVTSALNNNIRWPLSKKYFWSSTLFQHTNKQNTPYHPPLTLVVSALNNNIRWKLSKIRHYSTHTQTKHTLSFPLTLVVSALNNNIKVPLDITLYLMSETVTH